MSVINLFTDPDSFIKEKIKRTGIRWEFVLILVAGAFGAVGVGYVGLEVANTVEGTSERIRLNVIGIAFRPIIGLFLLWVGGSVLAHLVANRVYRGRGSIRRLLKGAAWAFIPLGIGNLLRGLTIVVAFLDEEIPANLEGTADEQLRTGLDLALTDPIVLGGTVVLLLTALYSGYLLSFAIKHSKGISQGEAFRTAAVPILVFVLFIGQGLV